MKFAAEKSPKPASVKLSRMVRSSGQPATSASATSIGARKDQAVSARRFASERMLLPARLHPLQVRGRVALAGERRVDRVGEHAGELVVLLAGDGRRARGEAVQDVG